MPVVLGTGQLSSVKADRYGGFAASWSDQSGYFHVQQYDAAADPLNAEPLSFESGGKSDIGMSAEGHDGRLEQ